VKAEAAKDQALKFVRGAKFAKAKRVTVELDPVNSRELDESAEFYAAFHGLSRRQARAFVVNATLRLEG